MDEETLIQNVLDSPEPEVSRLVYADWLEERGDSRFEFLRLECRFIEFGFDDSAVVPVKLDLLQLWEELDCSEWLGRVGIKYDVWLNIEARQHPDESIGRLTVVRLISKLVGIGLKGATELVADEGPSRIMCGLDLPKAENILHRSKRISRQVRNRFEPIHRDNTDFKNLLLSKLVTIVPSWREPLETRRVAQ